MDQNISLTGRDAKHCLKQVDDLGHQSQYSWVLVHLIQILKQLKYRIHVAPRLHYEHRFQLLQQQHLLQKLRVLKQLKSDIIVSNNLWH